MPVPASPFFHAAAAPSCRHDFAQNTWNSHGINHSATCASPGPVSGSTPSPVQSAGYASYDHKARLGIAFALTQAPHLPGTRFAQTVEPARIRRGIHLKLDPAQQLVQRPGVEIALKHTVLHATPEILEGLHDAPATPIVTHIIRHKIEHLPPHSR